MTKTKTFISRTFRAFRYRDFRLMWFGACASTTGTFVQQFAQSWLIYDLTNNPFYLGLDLFLGQLPIMAFSLFGGVFADRLDRRKMLLASQYIQMFCAFILALLFALRAVKVWQIMTLSFIVGLGQSFGGPAYSALLPTLVDKEDLPNAVAMNSIQFNLARIIGPTIGGLAYTNFGATWCFALNGASYLAVIASLLMINVEFIPAKSHLSVLTSMKEGLKFIRRTDGMSALVVVAFCTTLFGFSINGFLPVLVRTVFHGGPKIYTLLLVCSGAGSISGALSVAASEGMRGKGRLTLSVLVGLGIITCALSLSTSLPLSCILMFMGGTAIMASASFMLSLAQIMSTNAMRGRVMSVYNLAFRAGIPLGGLVLGRLIPAVGIAKSLTAAGLSLALLSTYFLLKSQGIFRDG